MISYKILNFWLLLNKSAFWQLWPWFYMRLHLHKPVNPKGNQSWIFTGRTDAEAPILWPPVSKSWLIGKDPDAGKDWRREEKGMTEDESVGWHHWLDRHKFKQALGVGDGQGNLACCSTRGCKESGTTEQLNWTDQYFIINCFHSSLIVPNM